MIANTGKYAKVIRDHIDQLEEVHNRHLDAVLAHFKLSKLHWKEVIERLSDSSQHQEEW